MCSRATGPADLGSALRIHESPHGKPWWIIRGLPRVSSSKTGRKGELPRAERGAIALNLVYYTNNVAKLLAPMLSRRLIGFRTNVFGLFSGDQRQYLWTFTLPKEVPSRDGARMWHKLHYKLLRWVPGWSCVRVFERHPGRSRGEAFLGPPPGRDDSHGLHVHCISTRFYWVADVRSACIAAGWGRVHVRRIRTHHDREKVANYLAKYLQKKRHESLRGLRLVGYSGIKDVVRHRDIVFTGHHADLWNAARRLHGWHGLNFFGRLAAVHWLNIQCICQDCDPGEMVDLFEKRAVEARDVELRKQGRIFTQSAERQNLLLLHQLGVIEADDNNRARRFTPKSLRLPLCKVSLS